MLVSGYVLQDSCSRSQMHRVDSTLHARLHLSQCSVVAWQME